MITYQHSPNILKQNLRSTENSLRVLCFNLLSLSYHILELHNVLSKCDLNFQVIDINEPRLKQSKKKKSTIYVPDYYIIEHCSSEGANAGALLYIK